jgi:hypothetical protein
LKRAAPRTLGIEQIIDKSPQVHHLPFNDASRFLAGLGLRCVHQQR